MRLLPIHTDASAGFDGVTTGPAGWGGLTDLGSAKGGGSLTSRRFAKDAVFNLPRMARQWHLDTDTYLATVRAEIPTYHDLQDRLADATKDVSAATILDLGSGTGSLPRRS